MDRDRKGRGRTRLRSSVMRWISISLSHLVLLAACEVREPDAVVHPRPEPALLSEPGFQLGGATSRYGGFGPVGHVRVSPDGGRVFVLEPDESRLTAWTPGGRMLFDLGGPGEDPGDFTFPWRMHLDDGELCVRDRLRFSCFAEDGTLLRAVNVPPASVDYQGFRLRVDALLADGSFVGVPRIPFTMRLGLMANDPVDSVPLLRIRQTGDGWLQGPLFTLNTRGATLLVPGEGLIYLPPHPYSTADRYVADPRAATVLVARPEGPHLRPGEAELLEVSVEGDTLWRHRLALDPVRPTRELLEATIEDVVKILGPEGPPAKLPRDLSEEAAELPVVGVAALPNPRKSPPRSVIEDALGTPEYLPAVSDLVLTSSGAVWLGTHERSDTLAVWYVMERGRRASPPRRVLLPGWFRVMDATETHVWGVWRDEMDIDYVVGRRLVPGS